MECHVVADEDAVSDREATRIRLVVRVPDAEGEASALGDEPRFRKDLVDKIWTRMASYLATLAPGAHVESATYGY